MPLYNFSGSQIFFSLSVKSITIPKMEMNRYYTKTLNGDYYIGEKAQANETWDVTTRINKDSLEYQIVVDWFKNAQKYKFNEIKTDALVLVQDLVDIPHRYFYITGIWPVNIPALQFDHDSTSDFMDLDISFSFDDIDYGEDATRFLAYSSLLGSFASNI